MATILVIDDDVQILWVIRRILEQAGHTVITASDGEKGFKLYHDSLCDLVITDMIMPGKSGMIIVADLLRDHPDTKIIAISGGGAIEADRYLNLARTLGAQGTLSKPFSIQALLDLVQNVLSKPAKGG